MFQVMKVLIGQDSCFEKFCCRSKVLQIQEIGPAYADPCKSFFLFQFWRIMLPHPFPTVYTIFSFWFFPVDFEELHRSCQICDARDMLSWFLRCEEQWKERVHSTKLGQKTDIVWANGMRAGYWIQLSASVLSEKFNVSLPTSYLDLYTVPC